MVVNAKSREPFLKKIQRRLAKTREKMVSYLGAAQDSEKKSIAAKESESKVDRNFGSLILASMEGEPTTEVAQNLIKLAKWSLSPWENKRNVGGASDQPVVLIWWRLILISSK